MSKRQQTLSIISFIVTPSFAFGIQDYRCTIERLSSAGDNLDNHYDSAKKIYVGKEFTVDRKSGVMSGTLKNSYITNPVVIDFGSKENSFKVVTTMTLDDGIGFGSNVHVLVVNEYVDTGKKPFVYLNNSDTYFGYCVHF